MKLESERDGNVAILRIYGNLMGGPEASKVHDEVKRFVDEDVTQFLIDLGEVPHMSSSGLGCLIACRASVTRAGGAIKLLRPASRIEEVLRITDLIRYFDCFNDEEEALQSFAT